LEQAKQLVPRLVVAEELEALVEMLVQILVAMAELELLLIQAGVL
jgi:hypothetical protein